MSTVRYPCQSIVKNDYLELEIDGDELVARVNAPSGEDYVVLNLVQVKAIINQLQEYLDETSESTPA